MFSSSIHSLAASFCPTSSPFSSSSVILDWKQNQYAYKFGDPESTLYIYFTLTYTMPLMETNREYIDVENKIQNDSACTEWQKKYFSYERTIIPQKCSR